MVLLGTIAVLSLLVESFDVSLQIARCPTPTPTSRAHSPARVQSSLPPPPPVEQRAPASLVQVLEERTLAAGHVTLRRDIDDLRRALTHSPERFGLPSESDFAWVVTTSLKPEYFARALDVHRTWGYAFSKLALIANDEPDGRRMLTERGCAASELVFPDETLTEFTCNGTMHIVLIKGCPDDHELTCKFDRALVHIVQRGWHKTARWIAQADDDIFVWPSNFFMFMSTVTADPIAADVVLSWSNTRVPICPNAKPPAISVTSAAVILSRHLFERAAPFSQNATMTRIGNAGFPWANIDFAFGLLLHNLLPWQHILLPMCDHLSNCRDDFVTVHGARPARGADESVHEPYCDDFHQSFDFWSQRARELVPGTQLKAETADIGPQRQLWSPAECAAYDINS